MTIDGKNYSRTILDKDSIRMFVEDLNKSALIGTYDKANPKNVDGLIALVMKDTFVIRLDLKENKINVPYYTECYELHEKYIAFFKKMGSTHLPK